jgi:hypothetical protein
MDPMDIVGKSKEDVSLPKCELHSLDRLVVVGFCWFSGFMMIIKLLGLVVVGRRVLLVFL